MHLSDTEGQKLIAKYGNRITVGPSVQEALAKIAERTGTPAKKGKRKKRTDKYQSQGESDFAAELESLRLTGQVKSWTAHPGRLRLSDKDPQTGRDRHYHPDFLVEWTSGYVEWIEVKGRHKWEDAVKAFDWTRDKYPFFRFRMVEKIDGEWVTIRGDNGKEVL